MWDTAQEYVHNMQLEQRVIINQRCMMIQSHTALVLNRVSRVRCSCMSRDCSLSSLPAQYFDVNSEERTVGKVSKPMGSQTHGRVHSLPS